MMTFGHPARYLQLAMQLSCLLPGFPDCAYCICGCVIYYHRRARQPTVAQHHTVVGGDIGMMFICIPVDGVVERQIEPFPL